MSWNEDSRLADLPTTMVLLVDRLCTALGALTNDAYLLVTIAGSPRYIQFAEFGGALRGETIGEQYLDVEAPITEFQRAWLLANGWNRPDVGGNYWRHWDPADPMAAATAGVVTLFTVHGVEDAGMLMFKSDDPAVILALTTAP